MSVGCVDGDVDGMVVGDSEGCSVGCVDGDIDGVISIE